MFSASFGLVSKSLQLHLCYLVLDFPELLAQEKNEEIQQMFPSFERRAVLEYRAVEDVDVYSDDVGNLDDFIEDMTPLEYEAHEMTKKLVRFRPHVPSIYR